MNRRLLFTLVPLLLGTTAHAQAPAARPDSLVHRQGVIAFQQTINTEFRNPEESPLMPAEREAFKTLPFYPTRYAYCVVANLVRDSTSTPFAMETSTARRPLYRKYGELRFVLNGKSLKLAVYQNQELLKRPGLEDYLFVPFTDLTNGHETYGGGRYLDLLVPAPEASEIVLDFNAAYSPFCAYNHKYSCPKPPADNRLTVPVLAGEQLASQ